MAITSATLPRQVYSHILNAIKGWFHEAALDFDAKISSNVTFTGPVFAGRCVHVNASGEFEMGVTGRQMGIFLLKNSDNPSVAANDGGGQTMTGWIKVVPRGRINGLVAKGAYELETTEYDTTQTYAPNDPLRAIASNSDDTTGGRLTNAGVVDVASASVATATAVVGHVSRAPFRRQSDRPLVLCFWPGHYPGATGL